IEPRVLHEGRCSADRSAAEEQLPSSLPDRTLQKRVRVLVLGEHARPERDVGEVPSSSKRLRVPRLSPDVADSVAGLFRESSARVPLPRLLGHVIQSELYFAAVPLGDVSRLFSWVPLPTYASAVGKPRRLLPHGDRIDEVRVLEGCLDEGHAAML